MWALGWWWVGLAALSAVCVYVSGALLARYGRKIDRRAGRGAGAAVAGGGGGGASRPLGTGMLGAAGPSRAARRHPGAARAFGDEMLQDRRLRPLYQRIARSIWWKVKSRIRGKGRAAGAGGDGLQSIFASSAAADALLFSPGPLPTTPIADGGHGHVGGEGERTRAASSVVGGARKRFDRTKSAGISDGVGVVSFADDLRKRSGDVSASATAMGLDGAYDDLVFDLGIGQSTDEAEDLIAGLRDDALFAFNCLVKQYNVFTSAELPFLAELCRHACVRRFARGSVVFEEGDPDGSLYIVKEGTCQMTVSGLSAESAAHPMAMPAPGLALSSSSSTAFMAAASPSPLLQQTSATSASSHSSSSPPVSSALPGTASTGAATANRPTSGTIPGLANERDGRPAVLGMYGRKTTLGGLMDLAAYIVDLDAPRVTTVKCLSDCEILVIPPYATLGRVREDYPPTCAEVARLLQMLLVRINRVSLMTAYCYLGLVYELPPNMDVVEIPQTLRNLSGSTSISPACRDEITQLVAHVLGVKRSALPLLAEQSSADLPVAGGTSNGTSGNGDNGDNRASGGDRHDNSQSTTQTSCPQDHLPPLPPADGTTVAVVSDENLDAGLRDDRSKRAPARAKERSNRRGNTGVKFADDGTEDVLGRMSDMDLPDAAIALSAAPSDGREDEVALQLMNVREGCRLNDVEDNPGLYIVLSGEMGVSVTGRHPTILGHNADGTVPFAFFPGSVIGQLSVLTDSSEEWYGSRIGPSPVLTLRAVQDTTLVRVSQQCYNDIARRSPRVAHHVAGNLIRNLPRILRVLDAATGWIQLSAGDNLVAEGDKCDGCLYVVLHGRMTSFRSSSGDAPGNTAAAATQGGGDAGARSRSRSTSADQAATTSGTTAEASGTGGDNTPGEPLHSPAHSTPGGGSGGFSARRRYRSQPVAEGVASGRITLVDEFGRGDLIGDAELLSGDVHKCTVRAVRQCAVARVPASVLSLLVRLHPSVLAHVAQHSSLRSQERSDPRKGPRRLRPRAITIVPVSGSVPLALFVDTLRSAFRNTGVGARVLTNATARAALHLTDADLSTSMTRRAWNFSVGNWLTQQEEQNQLLLLQAQWQDVEWNSLCCAHSDLVLLVANANDFPQVSEIELQLQEQLSHVRKMLVMLHIDPAEDYHPRGTRSWIEQRTGIHMHLHCRLHPNNLRYDKKHYKSDFSRMARILSGRAVGVVLSGGGARGVAHVGVLQALEENNVPVDFVGGTSIGSCIGGLYARIDSYLLMLPTIYKFCKRMGSVWDYLRDLTLPITSYFNGYGFNHEIGKALGRYTKIEDLWLNYFCVTTDLTTSSEQCHFNGTLWRYVRASMGLANFLPPVCDQDPNTQRLHYLVDGGYVNNLPADVMSRQFGIGTVIAVDVSGSWEMRSGENYGDMLSGLQVVLNNLNPFRKSVRVVPSMGDISTQLCYVSATRQLAEAKAKFVDLYIEPDVGKYSILEFDKYREIAALGYQEAMEAIARFQRRAWQGGASGANGASSSEASRLAAAVAMRRSEARLTMGEPQNSAQPMRRVQSLQLNTSVRDLEAVLSLASPSRSGRTAAKAEAAPRRRHRANDNGATGSQKRDTADPHAVEAAVEVEVDANGPAVGGLSNTPEINPL